MHWFYAYIAVGWLIALWMIPVILRRQFTPGAALAWLGIVFLHPYVGAGLYLLIGESRVGRRRGEAHQRLIEARRAQRLRSGETDFPADVPGAVVPVMLEAERVGGMPPVTGNSMNLIGDSTQFADALVTEIDCAQARVHLLYFILADDESGRRVGDALCRAAARGVSCRFIADAVASRAIFRRNALAQRLRAGGVHVTSALPVSPIRRGLGRMDFRNHRKLAVIDSRIAFVGSQNLINPDYGGKRGAPWIDLTARYTGRIVHQLEAVFCDDWALETGQEIPIESHASEVATDSSNIVAQAIPTGPGPSGASYRKILLSALHSARQRITLTSPYFVPDEPTLVGLQMAADRGVDVKLILPRVSDQVMSAAAGRAQFTALMEGGIGIWLFEPGLIHAKTIVVDDALAIVGSANLDIRSFMLNFELSVATYGPVAAAKVREMHSQYLAMSKRVDAADWSRRPMLRQYTDRALSLLSPLL